MLTSHSDTPTLLFRLTELPLCAAWAVDGWLVSVGEERPPTTGVPLRHEAALDTDEPCVGRGVRHASLVIVAGSPSQSTNMTAACTRFRAPSLLIPDAVTMHSLRHTYASLLVEAGADPAYVMAQIGHRNARFTLEVYTHAQNRKKNATAALDALIRGETPAAMGTTAQTTVPDAAAEAVASDGGTAPFAAVPK